MTNPTLSKPCNECKIVKPFTAFYKRTGYPGDMPGHYISECKTCMKQRSKNAKRLHKHKPSAEHEATAIKYLARMGIHALPGKALAYADVDVIAWGAVRVEVKLGRLQRMVHGLAYMFSVSKVQQKRGLLADVVMLMVPRKDGMTYHLFEPDFKPFYNPDTGHLKTAFYYRTGAVKPMRGVISALPEDAEHFMTEDDMQYAQDRVSLIWEKMRDISREMRNVNDKQHPTPPAAE